MAGIRDLARECGVSVATVSRALNGHPEVSAATRAQIWAAARRLGYQPSQSARALVRGRSDTVGLLWDTGYETGGHRHPFLQDLMTGIKRALGESGRHLLLLNIGGQDRDEQLYAETARQHQLDGVIMMGMDPELPAVRALTGSGLPCVAFDTPLTGPRSSYVTSDNRSGAAEAVRHLYALGHRRIATITGPPQMMPAAARLAGFQDAAQELGLRLPPGYVQPGDFFLDSGYAAGRRLAALPHRPTGVFAAGDEMAIGALHAFADLGIDVPRQMAVVGFDNIEAASLVRPALTTVAQDPLRLGSAAVHLLLDLVAGAASGATRPVPPRTVPAGLVIRGSCARPRS
ncbi:LacI family transcriptional regulator [Streptacidiphilus sp. PB12-B1b]|uniref:LacI family DNA-binding transcriptional regulator n=1 Tax=Streptacidiphilus sp. PB12-B1b TaxID=2705012 RepID=UPI0015FB0853|nr:LacI family DNA-binding transcriptional regulator [Streptacidiphilus sp. PB12-B1b]QMU77753.1 LacI family transcriptional regulator [Streptacidiphilus sp. PB12-B1b]